MQVINTLVNLSERYKHDFTSTEYYFTMQYSEKCDHFDYVVYTYFFYMCLYLFVNMYLYQIVYKINIYNKLL